MRPSCTPNPLRSCLNFRLRFGSSFGASCVRFWSYFGRVSGSNLAPRKVSKLKRPMCTKLYYLQYETMVFNLPMVSKVEEKSMSKRLQDKIGLQEALLFCVSLFFVVKIQKNKLEPIKNTTGLQPIGTSSSSLRMAHRIGGSLRKKESRASTSWCTQTTQSQATVATCACSSGNAQRQ